MPQLDLVIYTPLLTTIIFFNLALLVLVTEGLLLLVLLRRSRRLRGVSLDAGYVTAAAGTEASPYWINRYGGFSRHSRLWTGSFTRQFYQPTVVVAEAQTTALREHQLYRSTEPYDTASDHRVH